MRRIVQFYKTASGKCPVKDFLDSLPSKVAQKVTWVLSIIEDVDIIPKRYFKKFESQELWECRVDFAGNTYRLLCFFHKGTIIVLTNGFMKKTQKTPKEEIDTAKKYKEDFLHRNGGSK